MKNKFAERLKESRILNGMSQDQLAKLIGVTQRAISNWEMGIRQPDFDMLIKIAIALDETTDYLLGLTD